MAILLCALLIFTAPYSALAEIYKCIDKEGNYHFTDDPTNLSKECSNQIPLATENHINVPNTSIKSNKSNSTQDDAVKNWMKLLPGIWKLRNDKQQFSIEWVILEDGTCTLTITNIGQSGLSISTGYGRCKISNGKLVSTYTKNTNYPINNRADNIIRLDETTLDLGGDLKYTRSK